VCVAAVPLCSGAAPILSPLVAHTSNATGENLASFSVGPRVAALCERHEEFVQMPRHVARCRQRFGAVCHLCGQESVSLFFSVSFLCGPLSALPITRTRWPPKQSHKLCADRVRKACRLMSRDPWGMEPFPAVPVTKSGATRASRRALNRQRALRRGGLAGALAGVIGFYMGDVPSRFCPHERALAYVSALPVCAVAASLVGSAGAFLAVRALPRRRQRRLALVFGVVAALPLGWLRCPRS
jgi:hypothetical protein